MMRVSENVDFFLASPKSGWIDAWIWFLIQNLWIPTSFSFLWRGYCLLILVYVFRFCSWILIQRDYLFRERPLMKCACDSWSNRCQSYMITFVLWVYLPNLYLFFVINQENFGGTAVKAFFNFLEDKLRILIPELVWRSSGCQHDSSSDRDWWLPGLWWGW